MSNADELRRLIAQHKLSRERAAQLCGVSIHTVNAWLLPSSNKAFRNMPAGKLRLMQLDLQAPAVK